MRVATWLSGALLPLVAACSADGGNTGLYQIPDALVAAVPWTNGAVALLNHDGTLVAPNLPVYPPIATGFPDPGSGPIDCTPLAAIDVSPLALVNFEPDVAHGGTTGVGPQFSSYDDATYGSFRVTGDASWYPNLLGTYTATFGLAAEQITKGPSCDGQPNDWAMHIRGGRFNYYGAGMEHPLGLCPLGSDLCAAPAAPGATVDSAGFPVTLPDGTLSAASPPHQFWDISQYDGIVLWARSGPESTDGLLVAIQDKFTSDALNRQSNTYCKRIKTCTPTCLNYAPCTLSPAAIEAVSTPIYRCYDPKAGIANNISEPAELELVYPRCGPSACVSPSYYIDADFDPTQCKPYEFSGKQAAYYCYGDEPPPDESERCDDGFVTSISLSTQWRIYVLPFSGFQQAGYGKPAPFMDLRSVYEVAFEFPVGFVDVYIDNVSFYRNR